MKDPFTSSSTHSIKYRLQERKVTSLKPRKGKVFKFSNEGETIGKVRKDKKWDEDDEALMKE